jgi:hypothetical protein
VKKIKLKELTTIIRGKSLPQQNFNKSGELLYLTGRNIQDGSIVLTKKDRFLQLDKKYKKWVLRPGDIIITTLWNKRKIYEYKKTDPPSISSSNQIILRTDQNDYLSKYFVIERFYNQFELDCQNKLRGSVIPFLSLKDISEIDIYRLSENEISEKFEEQKKLKIGKNELINSINKNNLDGIQKEYLNDLVNDHFEDPVLKLSKQYENTHLEFKSSFKKDLDHGGKVEQYIMINSVIKTIGGFCNTGGGNLLIGVSDDNKILGIEIDVFKNNDEFLRSLTEHISEKTFPDVMKLPGVIDISLHQIEKKKTICKVYVEPTQKSVLVNFKNKKEFYKRDGPKTIPLGTEEMLKYVKEREKVYNE